MNVLFWGRLQLNSITFKRVKKQKQIKDKSISDFITAQTASEEWAAMETEEQYPGFKHPAHCSNYVTVPLPHVKDKHTHTDTCKWFLTGRTQQYVHKDKRTFLIFKLAPFPSASSAQLLWKYGGLVVQPVKAIIVAFCSMLFKLNSRTW